LPLGKRVFSLLFCAFLAYTLLLLLPVLYQTTFAYLDSSWGYGLNYFLHSRFHFGPDLMFTYGPLGFVNNPQHVSHNIAVALAVKALFWVALGVQLVRIWRGGKRAAAFMFCLSLAFGHALFYDYWDYSLMALTLITVMQLFRSTPSYFDYCLLPVLMGVSFLLKFTAFTVDVFMLSAYALHLLVRRSLTRALAIWLAICFLGSPLAYLVYDPSLSGLAQYLSGALQIAGGFATVMSTDNFPTNILFVEILCALLLLQIVLRVWKKQLFLGEAILIMLVTWTIFRHGFVRGSYGDHSALFFGFVLLVFACFFMGWKRTGGLKGSWPEIVLCLAGIAFYWISLSGFAERYPVLVTSNFWPQRNWNDLQGLFRWHETARNLDHSADSQFAELPGMAFRDSIERRRVMVFPFGTPYVAKITFEMFPIYALQAYQTYTASLDRKAAQNLVNANPPVDKILVEWGAIDGRNPVLDVPALYTAFLTNFRPERRVPNALLLQRRDEPRHLHFTVAAHEAFKPGEWVPVPPDDELVAVSIKLNQTLLGTLITNVFDQEAVYLDFETQSGKNMHYRVPPRVLTTPVPVNYVPQSLDDFEKMWGTEPSADRVTRVRLSGPGLSRTYSKGYYFYHMENLDVRFAR